MSDVVPGYSIPAPENGLHREEILIKRSRFIVSLAHAPDTEQARVFIDAMRREFPDATHNCWAFAAGPPGCTARIGYSDDGEPHGTAGRPMLTVLLHGGVGEIVAVVTRYFGGIKLGAGGLVRAYQGSVQAGMESLPTAVYTPTRRLEVLIDYACLVPLRRLLPDFGARVESENFGQDASCVLAVPEEQIAPLVKALQDLSGGTALTQVLDAED